MLAQAHLSPRYWEEAISMACYLQNRSYNSTLQGETHYARWFGTPPTLNHLRIFGCPAYELDTHPPSKLAPRSTRHIFVGYGDPIGIKAYKLFNTGTHAFLYNRSVVFFEDFLLHMSSGPTFDTPSTSAPVPLPSASDPPTLLLYPTSSLHGDSSSSGLLTSSSSSTAPHSHAPPSSQRLLAAHSHASVPPCVDAPYDPSVHLSPDCATPPSTHKILPAPAAQEQPVMSSIPAAIPPTTPVNLPTLVMAKSPHLTSFQLMPHHQSIPSITARKINNLSPPIPCSHATHPAAPTAPISYPSGPPLLTYQCLAHHNPAATLLGPTHTMTRKPAYSSPSQRATTSSPSSSHSLHHLSRPTHIQAALSPPPSAALTPSNFTRPTLSEVESQTSDSATSPPGTSSSATSSPNYSPTSSSEALPIHPRVRLLEDIYQAACFHTTLSEEGVSQEIPAILEDNVGPSIAAALNSDGASAWIEALHAELAALHQCHTWTLVPRPPHNNIIGYKWLLKRKLRPDAFVERYKAPLIARGFTQHPGVDYNDTYSPILGMLSFCLLVAISTSFDLPLHHFDVITAFLHGMLDEEIYMHKPPHFIDSDHPISPLISLIPITPLMFVACIAPSMASSKALVNGISACTIISPTMVGITCLVIPISMHFIVHLVLLFWGLFVDDIPVVASHPAIIDIVHDMLASDFPISDKGPMDFFLGISVLRDPHDCFIKLCQSHYIMQTLEQSAMHSANGQPTPLALNAKLAPELHPYTKADATALQDFKYNKLLGQLRYLITCTRMDLCYAMHILSRALQLPRHIHRQAALRCLRYVKHTMHYSSTFHHQDGPLAFTGYVDADWAAQDPLRHSTSGYLLCTSTPSPHPPPSRPPLSEAHYAYSLTFHRPLSLSMV
ncbi:hypothetical protein L7F22_004479 [Adiantum nelumboides]|nr:hypothetical protein [Adiantum nelumboides]